MKFERDEHFLRKEDMTRFIEWLIPKTWLEVSLMNFGKEEVQRTLSDSEGEKTRYIREIEREIEYLAKHFTDLGVATSKTLFRTAVRILDNLENYIQEQFNQLSVLDEVYEGRNDDIIEAIRKLEEIQKLIKSNKEKFEKVLRDLDVSTDAEMYKKVYDKMYEAYKSFIRLSIFGFPTGKDAEEVASKIRDIIEVENLIRKEAKKIGLEY